MNFGQKLLAGTVAVVSVAAMATVSSSYAATSSAPSGAVRSSVSADPGLSSRTFDESRASRSVLTRRSLPTVTAKPTPVHRATAVSKPPAAKRAAAAPTPKPTVRRVALSAAPVTKGGVQATAQQLLAGYGWGSQFGCLNNLYTRESGWRTTAANPSGAYGIPQAMPGSKMASAGADWRTNPATQIAWGLSYIKSTYGSPCQAWSFWLVHHWY